MALFSCASVWNYSSDVLISLSSSKYLPWECLHFHIIFWCSYQCCHWVSFNIHLNNILHNMAKTIHILYGIAFKYNLFLQQAGWPRHRQVIIDLRTRTKSNWTDWTSHELSLKLFIFTCSACDILSIRLSGRRHCQYCHWGWKLHSCWLVEPFCVLWPHVQQDICENLVLLMQMVND